MPIRGVFKPPGLGIISWPTTEVVAEPCGNAATGAVWCCTAMRRRGDTSLREEVIAADSGAGENRL